MYLGKDAYVDNSLSCMSRGRSMVRADFGSRGKGRVHLGRGYRTGDSLSVGWCPQSGISFWEAVLLLFVFLYITTEFVKM